MSEKQQEFWAGAGGDAYTARNRVDWRRRRQVWRDIMLDTGARSVLEIGCNAGWNLTAIKEQAPWARAEGVDMNRTAVLMATLAGCQATPGAMPEVFGPALDVDDPPGLYELVFTAGVLIHVDPEDLEETMRQIVVLSSRWVLAIEYEAEAEEEITYRGEQGLLWKRPYGKLYEAMGLRHVRMPWPIGKDLGFDNCTAHLMEKP